MRRTMTEVRTFNIKLYCDCGGEFVFNGNADMSYPPQYVHLCIECGGTCTHSEQYPTKQDFPVGDEQEVPDVNPE